MANGAASLASANQLLALPGLDVSDGWPALLAATIAFVIVFLLTPPLIRKMHEGGMVGQDVNKDPKQRVAELGGISAVFAFSVSLSLVVGVQKLLGNVAEPPFLAAISVFFMASMIGLIDDVSDLKQRFKGIAVAFAALPLMLVHFGPAMIYFPLGFDWDFSGSLHLVYWLLLVPLGVTGVANAMNMSAGYNGLETGQIAIVSGALFLVGEIRGVPQVVLLVFGALMGCALALYYYNKFPARIFVGDIGTLGFGAAIAAGVVLGHIEFYGLVAIAPAFYEAAATTYYGLRKQNGNRKLACQHPVIQADGTLQPPSGAGRYTLAYWLLARRPMTERALVRALLGFYAASGAAAILLSVL